MGKFIDITGKKYGRYSVIRLVNKNPQAVWECKCDCGNIRHVLGTDLRQGKTKSCGCYLREWAKTANRTHGLSKTRIYYTWQAMRKRCKNQKEKEYYAYGGRGIKVCEEWDNSFEKFYEWAMKNGYTDELTIDRIDVNGNYEPSNCRFVTMKQQMNNKTDNHYLIYNGISHTIAEWSEITGIKREAIKDRVNKLHWSTEDALTKPVRKLTKREH